MISLLLLMVLRLASPMAYAMDDPYIQFESSSWEQVLQKANKEKKHIFLYAYTRSCRYCAQMEREVFNKPEVAGFYNANFVSYKINIEDNATGTSLAKKYGIVLFPMYLFLDANAKPVHQSAGGKPIDKFILDGKNAFNPETSIFTLKEKYDGGDRSPGFLYNFANALETYAGDDNPLEKVVSEYLATQSLQQLQSERNLRFIFAKRLDFRTPASQYILNNAEKFEPIFGKEIVKHRVQGIVTNTARTAGRKNDGELFKELVTSVGQKYPYSNQLLGLSKIYFYGGQRNWNKFALETWDYSVKVDSTDWQTFYETAAYVKAFAEDVPTLEVGARLIKKAIHLNRNYEYLCIYATLLHKVGENKMAIDAAKQALALAESTGADRSEAKELLTSFGATH